MTCDVELTEITKFTKIDGTSGNRIRSRPSPFNFFPVDTSPTVEIIEAKLRPTLRSVRRKMEFRYSKFEFLFIEVLLHIRSEPRRPLRKIDTVLACNIVRYVDLLEVISEGVQEDEVRIHVTESRNIKSRFNINRRANLPFTFL
jgi:hypothetical protein